MEQMENAGNARLNSKKLKAMVCLESSKSEISIDQGQVGV